MSDVPPTVEYLVALRRQQLGQDVGNVEALSQRARAANEAAVRGQSKRARSKTRHVVGQMLRISSHARKRMSERGMAVSEVVAIYLHGDPEPDRVHANRTRYRMTRKALGLVDAHVAARLRAYVGDVIVVASPRDENDRPTVVTVLPFGERTR